MTAGLDEALDRWDSWAAQFKDLRASEDMQALDVGDRGGDEEQPSSARPENPNSDDANSSADRGAVRQANREALCRLGVTELERGDGKPVLLLDGIFQCADQRLLLSVARGHDTRSEALGSIRCDGVNPLPSIIVDLDARRLELEVIDYDPVHGMSLGTGLLLRDHDYAESCAEDAAEDTAEGLPEEDRRLLEEISDELGHFDDSTAVASTARRGQAARQRCRAWPAMSALAGAIKASLS